ncbi:zinc finger and BTB domain-containing protein 24 isoform X2 [Gouania willdenowi]|uniref:zinc finger and BTB domain-containing protein 24 isoform X2 n=1 Tax=Gouania willdenowi TaxID=441366 RepID=UPI00105657CD|nr:zinc finger and BTB domain-containing protein 24 isoform X2 [Gouania willdenowi]
MFQKHCGCISGEMFQEVTSSSSSFSSLHSETHQQSILLKLDGLRRRDVLCDVTLVVEDVLFKAHRALLAASSEFFSLMFTAEPQNHQSVHQLDGVTARTFSLVLEFIYSAQVCVEESVAKQLLATARLLKVSDLVNVLADLQQAPGHEVKSLKSVVADVQKHKRGRPKKSTGVLRTEPGGTPEGIQAGSQLTEDPGYNNPREHQSKRRIRSPVKYKGYKVGNDEDEGKQLRKRGRKRKYPRTEARCEDCGKVFKNQPFLKIHQRTHTGEKPFQCKVCMKRFTQKHTLLDHQRIHTGEKPFICSICSKALSTKHSLQEHMNLHKEEKSFDCDKCGKSFTQSRQLKSHYRVHTGKSLPECAQCHHRFMDTAQLKKHLRTHTGEKPFTCDVCGKCFTAKSTLQTHIRIHRGEKPYDCNICNKTFSDSSARRRHVASHSGKKPFTCSLCSLSFTRLDNLKTHTKSHNKETAALTKSSDDSSEAVAIDADSASAGPQEEVQNLLQLQPYQLPSASDQDIQLVVSEDVGNMNFVPEQELSVISTEGGATQSPHPRLTLLPQSSVQNVALLTHTNMVDPSPQIHTISMLEGQMNPHYEQMHVITLSKEAMEQLQPLHMTQHPVQQLQMMNQPDPQDPQNQALQAIRISSQSSQPINISQTNKQISNHHIQGPTFQIQAGTVSYLYTTGMAQDS